MSREEGRRERVYLMTMALAKKLLVEGIITEALYQAYDTKMRQKYEPSFSIFLAEGMADNPC